MQDTGPDDPRLDLLRHWLETGLGWPDSGLAPASADASFRRYFRVDAARWHLHRDGRAPGQGGRGPYLKVAGMLADIGVNAPRVLARNATDGFLLLTDLGSTTYLAELADHARAADLYRDAIDALVRIQAARRSACRPAAAVRREAAALRDEPVPGLAARAAPRPAARRFGRDSATGPAPSICWSRARWSSRAVFVHRDYHSRNLMVCAGAQSGHPRFPGCGARPAHLRPGLAAARLLRRVAAGAGRGVGARLPAAGASRRDSPARRRRGDSSCAGST